MKAIHLIESFQDLVKAFSDLRRSDDPVPMMDEEAELTIESDGHMILKSERFALSNSIKYEGASFVKWCVGQKIQSAEDKVNIIDLSLGEEEEDLEN